MCTCQATDFLTACDVTVRGDPVKCEVVTIVTGNHCNGVVKLRGYIGSTTAAILLIGAGSYASCESVNKQRYEKVQVPFARASPR